MKDMGEGFGATGKWRVVSARGTARRHLAAMLAVAVVASGCSLSSGFSTGGDLQATSFAGVGHYGSGIVVTDYSIADARGMRIEGWGGGGGSFCCVRVPREIPDEPFFVTVKWETYRQKVDETREHEATVPVHFEVPPDQSGGIYAHFFPGHRVELWVTDAHSPYSTHTPVPYGGPPFPRGPAPLYQPLPGEKPWPPGTTAHEVRTKMVGESD
ncbi:DUF3304 domain-containing protein [Variovorax dokdonensis]|uniref:DUF3304 domain-containing protein n=1 Tax=Variovorax dokdonensis TaxID=344883 RepID=A0ABT7N647_9BURK|nr:DUF3304 domain-containing protein [Variovorax dokdonensis]MDM0043424.1 DUF3304 domain-containing protein [Variovorax dokdonensis]